MCVKLHTFYAHSLDFCKIMLNLEENDVCTGLKLVVVKNALSRDDRSGPLSNFRLEMSVSVEISRQKKTSMTLTLVMHVCIV